MTSPRHGTSTASASSCASALVHVHTILRFLGTALWHIPLFLVAKCKKQLWDKLRWLRVRDIGLCTDVQEMLKASTPFAGAIFKLRIRE
jgi:hypothetical protein